MSARPLPAEGAAAAAPAFSPLYQQIKALLTRSLSQGEWKPGEGLPSEPELARRFKVSQGTVRANADIARALELKAGDGVLQLRRLLLCGAAPVVLDEIWLPARLFKGLTAERLAAYRGPMYGMFESGFGVQMIRAEEKIRAVAASAADAALLNLAEGAPLAGISDGDVVGPLGRSPPAHAVGEARGHEARLGEHEAVAFSGEQGCAAPMRTTIATN